jgi:NADH-quinone oxidoreductase subunit H
MLLHILYIVAKILCIIVPMLLAVAYFTLAERKILGAIQRRRGPNVIGVWGLLQPLSDGLKLLVKEVIIPSNSNKIIFVFSPALTFFMSLLGWAVIPFSKYAMLSDLNFGLLYILAISSLGVYGIIMSGWSSNSKYAFLGSLRSTAQMVSYEVSIGFILCILLVSVGSLNLSDIVNAQQNSWFVIGYFPLALLFFISALAETNRHPFDLPEAEAELVSGYNVEYSAVGFALFSLGEYGNMLLMSSCTVLFFLGGWLSPFQSLEFTDLVANTSIFSSFWFGVKIIFMVIVYVWIRAALPRYRYDQLMSLGWKVFLPLSLFYLLMVFFVLLSTNSLP